MYRHAWLSDAANNTMQRSRQVYDDSSTSLSADASSSNCSSFECVLREVPEIVKVEAVVTPPYYYYQQLQ
jgi:hypothetical protein